MAKPKQDQHREQQIEPEMVVDAYDAEQRATGWYSYLEDQLHFSFGAKCGAPRPISPLRKGQEVEVPGLAAADEGGHEMFVMITWEERMLAWISTEQSSPKFFGC